VGEDHVAGGVRLPMGARLKWLGQTETAYRVLLPDGREVSLPKSKGAVTEDACGVVVDRVIECAERLLGTPYRWGGKTSAGIDCSGLVQTAFAASGIYLPRDSDQQSQMGRLTATRWFRGTLRRGDTLYFLRADGRVGHTAIYLGDNRYLEAVRPVVRVTSFDPKSPDYSASRAASFAFAKRLLELPPHLNRQTPDGQAKQSHAHSSQISQSSQERRPQSTLFPVSFSDPSAFVLWDPNRPVPTSAECPRLKDVQFYVVQPREPEVDGYNWLHGAAICWHEGRLYATFGHNRGSENTASEVADGRVSTDGGKTWGPVFAIDDAPNRESDPAVSHGVLLSHAGRLGAFQGEFHDRMQDVHTCAYRRDEDTGRWQPLGVVAEQGFWPMQEPLKMDDGNWIMAGISVHAGYGGPDDPAAVAISRGDDFRKWDVVRIPKPKDLVMWGESTVIPDGARVLLISRWSKPWALAATSNDYGRTWTEIRASNLPMSASKPYAGTLSTGQRYLIGTTTADAGNRRRPLTIAVSRPGRRYFSRIYRIRDAIDDGCGESDAQCRLAYPYAVEHEGRLYVIYSNDGGRGGNRNSAELAVIPIRSLRAE